MTQVNRRSFLAGSGALAGLGLLSGCGLGGAGGGNSGSGQGTVRFAFWGNDERREFYEEAFGSMGDGYPDMRINMEFADYGAFQERITTQMAARNVSDVFWIPAPQVMTYYANNLYAPMSEIPSLDLADYSSQDIEDFSLDGEHNTMPFGISVPVVRVNSTFAEEDGVEIPEDWTWEWLAEFARDYTNDNPHGRRAMPFGAHFDLPFEGWLRQHGEQLWTEEGGIGFTVDGLASYIDWWKKLLDDGATTTISEQDGVQVSWTDVGDQCLLWFGNSNHIVSEALMYPDYDFSLRNIPVLDDAASGHPFLYTPRMAVYAGVSDEQKELAGHVLQYCTSDVEMTRIVGLTMGVPPNPRVAAEYEEFATAEEQEMLTVVNHERDAERLPRYEAPPGTSGWRDIMERSLESVTLDNANVTSAAESMIEQIQRDIDRTDV